MYNVCLWDDIYQLKYENDMNCKPEIIAKNRKKREKFMLFLNTLWNLKGNPQI